MTITPNQFSMVTTQGDLDLQFQGSVATMQVSANQATALVAGQAVKLEDAAGSPPPVVALAANTDSSFGFVVRTLKDIEFDTLSAVEVAMAGSVMQMTTGAAVARGAKLEVVYTTNKVITNAGTNPVMGFALDKATGADQLIRVYILTPSYGLAQTIADIAGLQAALDVLTAADAALVLEDTYALQTYNVTATLSEINAGKILIPLITGKQIRVVNYAARIVGTAADNTSVDLQSGVTGTKVAVLANADLADGAVLQPYDGALGAGFAADLESGETLKVVNVGTAMATLTSITFTITAQYV